MKHLKLKHHQKLNQRKKDGLIKDLIDIKKITWTIKVLRFQKFKTFVLIIFDIKLWIKISQHFLKINVESKKSHLFLVVLGVRVKKANVELHDVRWVIGSKIEDTYDSLREDWFGMRDGLHIDSFKKIIYVDEYKINLKNIENKKLKINIISNEKITKKNLTLVNIGGYDSSSMQEKHEFGLVVAKSSLEAKNKSKSKSK